MRDYAKLAPTFWTGETGKALRRRGFEGVVVALYLVSSPHSNMLGLFYQPIPYMGHETGLGEEGARKGLQSCIDLGFCSYDDETEMVFVHEMAAWQIADELSSTDKRCKGIQKDYDALPNCPFLGPFFDHYSKAFHLKGRRAGPPEIPESKQAPPKPLRSQEQEQEQEQDPSEALRAPQVSGAKAPAAVAAAAFADSKPLTAKDRVWLLGVPLLGEGARGLLGKLAKTHGDEALAGVLAEATLEKPIEPKAWVIAACAAKPKSKPSNGHHDPGGFGPGRTNMQADHDREPRPEWVVQAGFENIWEAENVGCYPHTAHKFRAGKRVDA